jgi:WD domain, G-beta repeat
MSAYTLPPTAPTTLVIMLGASAWPNSPGFQASQAFAHAAQGFRDYVLDPHGFCLPAANLFDQFDALASTSDQLEMLGSFLEQRTQALKEANQLVRDVLVYFVGHGGFAGPSADFYLMPRRTNASSLRASGIAIDALAEVLREKARQTRRYLLLDCCFAAAAFSAFQGGPDQTAITKTLDVFRVQARGSGFPGKGTVLLCSSDQKSPSLLLPDESCTMFSYALLDVLRNGDIHRPPQLSLRDIKELAEDRLAALPEKYAPRPGLHSPDQSEGDVADIPFFPNTRIEEERRRPDQSFRQKLGDAGQLPLQTPVKTIPYTYRGHSKAVHAVAWSPDGKRIASGSADHTVQVWDAE